MDITLNSIIKELIYLAVAFIIALIVRRVIHIFIEQYFARLYKSAQNRGRSINKKRLNTLARAFKSLAAVSVWIIFIFVLLGHFNVNTAALLTGAGAVGIFFSIAGKDIIMDLYVGFMALVEDQYRVGDVITIDQDHSGTVQEITLRTIKLRDIDGNIHIVPHSLARSIINKTYDYSVVNVELGVAYDADMDAIKDIVNKTGEQIASEKDWKQIFIEPVQYQTMLRFDESQQTFRAQGKVKPGKQWAAASEFRMRIKDAFDDNGIEIPFPQRVVRTVTESAPKKIVKSKSKK